MKEAVSKAVSEMIISASGWRKVFGNHSKPDISKEDAIISGCAALATLDVIKPKSKVLVGTDTRPTGPALAMAAINVFKAHGVDVTYLGVSAAPEIMAESRQSEFDYFFYISASHNPIDHNGFKFGRDGGVFSKGEVQPIIDEFYKIVGSEETLQSISLAIIGEDPVIEGKERALKDYHDFLLSNGVQKTSDIGIAIDFNGSARCVCVDMPLLKELGIRYVSINDRPSEIVHAIVPEGENLEFCRRLLESQHEKDPSFILGYVPDNDGDRGNLVFIDDDNKAKILQAQTVFALICLSELATLKTKPSKLAIAANGPTSMRIDEIASFFNAQCIRAEVGEANAVQLAQNLRDRGFTVPLCGEGSNGGCIIHPSKVRDPMTSILSLIRLLSDPQALEKWIGKRKASIGELVRSLPSYTTTDAFSPLAGIKVKANDFFAFKDTYEKLWVENFEALKQYSIASYQEYQSNGTETIQISGVGGRTGYARGGLKYMLFDSNDDAIGYVWLRPSGTEPLLRLLVDLKGDRQELHDKLLLHQRMLIEKTDALLQA